jgi:hypothetical protein
VQNSGSVLTDGQQPMKKTDPLQKTSVSLPEPNIWKETYQIRSYEVDCHHRLSVLSIFNFMQEAASRHAEALGVSIQQLLSENYTWLLSRLKIKIESIEQIDLPLKRPKKSLFLQLIQNFPLLSKGSIQARYVPSLVMWRQFNSVL